MAESTREGALKGLRASLARTIVGDDGVKRNGVLPQRIAPPGLILFDDGDPGEPEEMFSPAQDGWEHDIDVVAYVQERDDDARATALDVLAQSIAEQLDADRTLGGAVDFLEFGPLVPLHEPVEGAATIAAGTIKVTLFYETPAGGLA